MELNPTGSTNDVRAGRLRVVTPAFAVAVVLLGSAAVLSGPGADWLHIKQGKEPLPLKASLDTLSERSLEPYRVLRRLTLEAAVVDALGTDQYLNWALEDTSVPAVSPLRAANLLVTYYTGGSNLVPHTPDVCYLGMGYTPAQPHENQEVDAPHLTGGSQRLPVRVCTFARTAVFDHAQTSVVYTFRCNDGYRSTRDGVRLSINHPLNTYAYFSKVEVNFPRATRAQSVEGAAKLFDRLLPVLERDHWPDFRAAEAAARGRDPTGS